MVNHYARPRGNRGAWLDALLTNQAEQTGAELDDLREFVQTISEVKHSLIAVDNPAPARGYAAVLPILVSQSGQEQPNGAVARIHVLPNQSDDVYRALFSQIIVQTRVMRSSIGAPFGVTIIVDATTAADYVVEAVERLGAQYGLSMGGAVRDMLAESNETEGKAVTPDHEEDGEAVEESAPEEVEEIEVVEETDDDADEAEADEKVEVENESEVDYVQMNKTELVEAAKALGISSKGTATELRQRLIAHAEEAG